jgi:hypothetical protein
LVARTPGAPRLLAGNRSDVKRREVALRTLLRAVIA